MKIGRLGITAGLLSLVLGCSSIRTGLGYREVSGNHRRVFNVNRSIPFIRIQGNREIVKNLETYGRFDFSCGGFDVNPEMLRGNVNGHFESFGVGLSYFLADNLSVDFGGELAHAGIDMNVDWGKFSMSSPDNIYWGGLYLGATYEKKFSKNGFFFISGGYNLNDNWADRVNCELSGFSGVVGVGWRF
jgi:hypothetical protein